MKKLLLLLIIIIVGLMCVEISYARTRLARHEERFFKEVNRRPLVIALFYQDYRAMCQGGESQAESMRRAERIFEHAATNNRFKEGGLSFIMASAMADDMKNLAHSFGITRIPACILFNESELVRDEKGKPALLMSILSHEAIIRFINKFLHKELAENRRNYWRHQEDRAWAGPQVSVGVGVGWWGPGWGGYYDPYDYYPWTYYGGWGSGRGCGRGGYRNGEGRSSGCNCPCRKK